MILNHFYEAIMARIKDEVPEVKHFDLYFRQDEDLDDKGELPFLRPAVLFEFDPMDYETLGNKKKSANAGFKLHVISDVVQEADMRTAPAIRTKGHQHLELIDKLDCNLQGFSGLNFNSIGSVGIMPYQPNGMMIKHVMAFKTRLINTAAMHATITPTTPPDSEIIIENEV